MDLQAGDIFEVHLLPLFEQLPHDFEIFSGVVLPAGGRYSFFRRNYRVTSAPRRRLSIVAQYEDGASYSGQLRQVTGTLSVRPHRGWLINAGGDYNKVQLREPGSQHLFGRAMSTHSSVHSFPS